MVQVRAGGVRRLYLYSMLLYVGSVSVCDCARGECSCCARRAEAFVSRAPPPAPVSVLLVGGEARISLRLYLQSRARVGDYGSLRLYGPLALPATTSGSAPVRGRTVVRAGTINS